MSSRTLLACMLLFLPAALRAQAAPAKTTRAGTPIDTAQSSDPAAAEAEYRRAIQLDSHQFAPHAALGQLLAVQQQWAAARKELELAARLTPASGDRAQQIAAVDRTLARVDAELHDPAAASDALVGAIRLTSEQPDDTLLAAQLAEQANDLAGAAQQYRRVLVEDPHSTTAAEDLARLLIHEGNFADAEPVLKQALEQQPNDPVLLAESAAALAGLGKPDQAVAQLKALHSQHPDQAAITRMLADLLSAAGEPIQAEPLYRQLLAEDRDNADLLTACAENLVREQNWPQAVDVFEHSLRIAPAQEDAWSGLAFAASEDGRYALVLSALDRRAQYLAEGPATLFLRATALDHLHHSKQAALYYRRFLSEAQGEFPDEQLQARERLVQLH